MNSAERMFVNLKPVGTYENDAGEDLAAIAVREWVAHQLRERGHDYTRGQIRNVRFGEDTPHGSDVTPPEEPVESFVCDLKISKQKVGWWTDEDGWTRHEEAIEFISPAQLVFECLHIVSALREKSQA